MDWNVSAMYFSPTKTTAKIVLGIAKELSKSITEAAPYDVYDFTLPGNREISKEFTEKDIVVFGVPVYAARVPNILLKYLSSVKGNGALAIAITVYGNRNYDDALIELADILDKNGFCVIAAGAFIGEHSFSKILAKNRPDATDMKFVADFANQIANKVSGKEDYQIVAVKGDRPYRNYYIPKDENGTPVDIRKVTPKTNDKCINCLKCVQACPMGSIREADVKSVTGVCIKCGACVKICPVQAKYYDDKNYLHHKEELEIGCSQRREPEIFM